MNMMTNLPKIHQSERLSRENNLTPNRRRQWLTYKNRHAPDATKDKFYVHKWRETQSRHKYTKKLEKLQSRLKQSRISGKFTASNSFPSYHKKPEVPLPPGRGQMLLPILNFKSSGSRQLTVSFTQNDYMDKKEVLFYSEDRKRKILNHVPSPVSRIRKSILFRYESHMNDKTLESIDEHMGPSQLPPKNYVKYEMVDSDVINEETVTIVNRSLQNLSPIKKRQSVQNDHKTALQELKNEFKPNPYPTLPEFSHKVKPNAVPGGQGGNKVKENPSPDEAKTFTPEFHERYSKLPPITKTPNALPNFRSPPQHGKATSSVSGSQKMSTAKSYESKKSKKRRSLRGETREKGASPLNMKSQQRQRQTFLMTRWKIAIKLAIWLQRLCTAHRIIVDDSYNIKYTNEIKAGESKKPDILFDVTNYKMKNQMKVSETIKALLRILPNSRSEQDITTLKAALRNIKVIADHADAIQENIAKYGYFVSFEGKRVVTWENRPSLNYYVLLAGTAVVIKEDEKGNTNPSWFMQRGDVFGQREIFENQPWGWSVVTLDNCEFLAISKNDYRNIFFAGGGFFGDPDRAKFLKNLPLFRNWPLQILDDNKHHCFFRYFKRGAILAKNIEESEWIYIIKSGSCSVLKTLKVKEIADKVIFQRQRRLLKAPTVDVCNPQLVTKEDIITLAEHERIVQNHWATSLRDNKATVTQKMEIKKLLGELNIEKNESLPTVVEEEEHEDDALTTSTDNAAVKGLETEGSHLQSTYIQTGILKETSTISKTGLGSRKMPSVVITDEASVMKKEDDLTTDFDRQSIGQGTIDDFLSKIEVSSLGDTDVPLQPYLKPVFLNLRTVTKGGMCGLAYYLYQEQPSLTLVSNGAECLMINKKFFLDNLNGSLTGLREIELPYPTENSIEETYWSLMAWNAFQRQTIKRYFAQNI